VVLTPEEYDRLAYERAFVDAVGTGLKDAEEGRLVDHEEANRRMTEAIAGIGQA
jgi:predicted transcriptional regulator